MDADKLSLTLKDHPEIAAALAGASAGDTVTIKELIVIIDEIATDLMVGSVQECEDITVSPGPDSEEDETDVPAEGDASGVLSVMSNGYKK